MKSFVYLIALLSLNIFSQAKYITKTGSVNFEASVPSFEEVRAKNNSVTAIFNAENSEFAALVLVKGFRFKNALMEEHFNENYAESTKFPKATFKGKIIHDSNENWIEGTLTFHGKSKRIQIVPITYSLDNNVVEISGNFDVNASDFDIKIPKIVKNKISESVNVSFVFSLKLN
ncbi:YceI family protein [Sabulilitoribacter multivorans]|uniref:YceI family protein n=1 Tax=Flaviramulus multivorans TaxID=1304750 RepID=A0ABS9ILA2_9FLAO|nr:YceI family protein [Flaviramulus multivorans]MCF7561378.1 YceI family protein [Flaviramulus multivorans]